MFIWNNMQRTIEDIRYKQARDYANLKINMQEIIFNKLYKMQRNNMKWKRKFIECEINKSRKIRLWSNRYVIRPSRLAKASPEEVMDLIDDIICSNELDKDLSQLFEHPVFLTWKWRKSYAFDGKTAPASAYISLSIEWDAHNPESQNVEEEDDDVVLQ